MRDEIMAVKKELEEVKNIKQDGFAMEILKDYKKTNKRMFTALLIVLFMWFITIGYVVFLLNDIGAIEETIDINEVDNIEGSTIKIGDE